MSDVLHVTNNEKENLQDFVDEMYDSREIPRDSKARTLCERWHDQYFGRLEGIR
jgi:hypothetical protein